ncbi:18268_t:CDS:2 [Funneliformis geosporum]|uniref:13690_t:CDS:1 n=1 Tax=Funneliformis geosporum TaxID=1117311 RepID=A0A9W4SPN9_9GLOM|nr:18268_t:CDS:2 [Funneliformis geosporum]CAI2178117.1 13690_t:CDS:2 [Funneliformis geosporum]
MVILESILTGMTITIGGGTLLYFYQNELLYPAKYRKTSCKFAIPKFEDGFLYTEVILTTKDKVRIRAYVYKRPNDEEACKRPTVLALHGNRGSIGLRSAIVHKFYYDFKCNVVLLSYRGYGHSEGIPSEEGIKIDAQTALEYIRRHPILYGTKLILYGRSLGGAVAIDLAARNEDEINALILENTFLSIPKLLSTLFSPLKYLTFICTQIWSSDDQIGRIKKIPILFLSGKLDALVPQKQMKGLYELTNTLAGKEWKEFPYGNHSNTISQLGYWIVIEEFLLWAIFDKDEGKLK